MSFHKLNIRALDTGPAPGRQVELSAWAELLPDPYPARKHAEDLKQGLISDSSLAPETVAWVRQP